MKRDKKPAALSAVYRTASLLAGGFIVLSLTACGGSLIPGLGDEASLSQKAKPTVAFMPAQGVPDKYTTKINEQLTASIKEKGVQIVESKEADYIVKPQYIAQAEGKKGTKLVYALDVVDKGDNKIKRIEGHEVVSNKHNSDAWSVIDDEGVQKTVVKSTTELAAWIDNPAAQPVMASVAAPNSTPAPAAKPKAPAKVAAAKPVTAQSSTLAAATEAAPTPLLKPVASKPHVAARGNELTAVVVPISGAPGDGKVSLSEAMKRSLAQQGVTVVANSAIPGAYKIQGQVDMSTPQNGEQKITIKWAVVDPAGKTMEKTVVQNNKVEEGRLDKPWGEIADQAAGAAAMEVVKLLNKPVSGQAQQGTGGTAG